MVEVTVTQWCILFPKSILRMLCWIDLIIRSADLRSMLRRFIASSIRISILQIVYLEHSCSYWKHQRQLRVYIVSWHLAVSAKHRSWREVSNLRCLVLFLTLTYNYNETAWRASHECSVVQIWSLDRLRSMLGRLINSSIQISLLKIVYFEYSWIGSIKDSFMYI